MRKLLRSKGKTATDNVTVREMTGLRRGLRTSKTEPDEQRSSTEIDFDLAKILSTDERFLMGQCISLLDKTISKRRSIRNMHAEAYLHRARLGNELWRRFVTTISNERQETPPRLSLDALRDIWVWRVHPYKGYSTVPEGVSPEHDANYQTLRKHPINSPVEDFHGRWHSEFWIETPAGDAKYGDIAIRIWCHLTKAEIKLHNGPRENDDGPELRSGRVIERLKRGRSGSGLASARGERISLSVRDPRITRREKHGDVNGEAWHFRAVDWTRQEEDIYFGIDVAAKIYREVTKEGNGPFRSADFGRMLHDHFGTLKDKTEERSPQRKRLWSLHNHARAFYQRLAKSDRFKLADRAKGERTIQIDAQKSIEVNDRSFQLKRIVPTDKTALLSVLTGKKRNADIGELIRLGKLVVHASDLSLYPDSGDLRKLDSQQLSNLFEKRLDYLATSDGQAEIKRNEAFTRVWRNAVGLAQRSLRNWVEENPDDPLTNPNNDSDHDISQTQVIDVAIKRHTEREATRAHFWNHSKVLFGSDPAGPSGESRKSVLISDDETSNREVMRTFMRVSAELRNRSNHFCTKERLVDLVMGRSDRNEEALRTDGIVAPFARKEIGQKGAHAVDEQTVRRLDELLNFDQHMDRKILVDELNAIDFYGHCAIRDTLGRSALLREMSRSTSGCTISTPRFMAIARRAVDLAADDDASKSRKRSPLAELNLDNDAITRPGSNRFSVEVLRKLYQRGFRAWLHEGCPGLDDLGDNEPRSMRDVIELAVSEKKGRKKRANEADEVPHAHIESVLSSFGTNDLSDPIDFLKKLTAEGMIEERLNQTYNADPRKQKDVANRVERFRQELTLLLFECYLRVNEFEHVTDIVDLDEDAPDGKVTLSDIEPASDWQSRHWHSRFYAWLYLVPPEDISALRQQLMKSRALETRAVEEADEKQMERFFELDATLDDLDRLMALYCSVNTAGFDGTEHHDGIGHGEGFYEVPNEFRTILDADKVTPEESLKGTRRGLRQILRFGNMRVLGKIIEKHKVSSREVKALQASQSEENRQEREDRQKLHAAIIDACKEQFRKPNQKKQDWTGVQQMCADYSEIVSRTTSHDFAVNAARLTEYARLHNLMMRMIGRLADYTLIWERDMICLFLGLYYREQKKLGGKICLQRKELETKADLEGRTRRGNCAYFVLAANGPHADASLSIWGDRSGFLGLEFKQDADFEKYLSDEDSRKLFWRYFDGTRQLNPKDRDANNRLSSKGQEPHSNPRHAEGYQRIRNDFAHYNMFTEKGKGLHMTYQVNVVRSLFGYDRKLKNAVSKSIVRIAEQAGIELGFELRDDRLAKAFSKPVLMQHLTMVPDDERVPLGRCSVPRSSARFTSMVQALFDHNKAGHG